MHRHLNIFQGVKSFSCFAYLCEQTHCVIIHFNVTFFGVKCHFFCAFVSFECSSLSKPTSSNQTKQFIWICITFFLVKYVKNRWNSFKVIIAQVGGIDDRRKYRQIVINFMKVCSSLSVFFLLWPVPFWIWCRYSNLVPVNRMKIVINCLHLLLKKKMFMWRETIEWNYFPLKQ